MDDIFIFCDFLSDMNVSFRNGKKAPHKAVLLLSIAQLARDGRLPSNEICLDQTLKDTFADIWQQYVGASNAFTCNPAQPFKYMDSEPFWSSVDDNKGKIAEELLTLFLDDDTYSVLKTILINNYFDYTAQTNEEVENEAPADSYDIPVSEETEVTLNDKEYSLDVFLTMFSEIRTSSSNGKKLPHKAILVLSILDLICSGCIDRNRIEYNKEFKAQFNYNWAKYSQDTSFVKIPDIKKLLANMSKEKFWYSFSEEEPMAVLNPSLFELIKDRNNCYELRLSLVKKFLPESLDSFMKEYEIINADYKKPLEDE